MNKSIVIFGNSGCGKTMHLSTFVKEFKPDYVMDNWDGKQTLKNYTLALTNVPPPYRNKKVRILKWNDIDVKSILIKNSLKNRLKDLISIPGTTPIQVENLLYTIYPKVFTQRRNENFFTHQFTCIDNCISRPADDDYKVMLVIRYGWSKKKGWLFEEMEDETDKEKEVNQ